jgi:hypothetical protein
MAWLLDKPSFSISELTMGWFVSDPSIEPSPSVLEQLTSAIKVATSTNVVSVRFIIALLV